MALPLQFPEDFIWGSATAAHQVEGGNLFSDLAALEYAQPSIFPEPSGDAVDHWNRFDDDMAVLSAIGMKAYRFSIEWARVEPEDGAFSTAVLNRYQSFIDCCEKRGILPIVTFHHFTQPKWMARLGGMKNPLFVERFVRYCEFLARNLRGLQIVCTINELNVPVLVEHRLKEALKSETGQQKLAAAEAALGAPLDSSFLFSTRETLITNGIAAHRRARAAIKAINPEIQVGVTLSIQDERALPGGEAVRDARVDSYIDPFLDAAQGDDFIGVQTYTRSFSNADGTTGARPGVPVTVMGFEDCPEAVADTCRYVWKRTQTPIIITENGWAGSKDSRRGEFIRTAAMAVHEAIAEGVDIRGYLYWTLLDNFEWVAGYGPKFGLIGVDRTTQIRQIKPSAVVLGEIARANAVTPQANSAEPGEADEDPGNAKVRAGTPLGID